MSQTSRDMGQPLKDFSGGLSLGLNSRVCSSLLSPIDVDDGLTLSKLHLHSVTKFYKSDPA